MTYRSIMLFFVLFACYQEASAMQPTKHMRGIFKRLPNNFQDFYPDNEKKAYTKRSSQSRRLVKIILDTDRAKASTNNLNQNADNAQKFDHREAFIITTTLMTNNLRYLLMAHNNLGIEGAKGLAYFIKYNSSLIHLDLAVNNIQDEGAHAIAEVLKYNKNILHLNLSYNNIGDDGIESIAKMLETNRTLDSLALQENTMSLRGSEVLAHALKLNPTLISLARFYPFEPVPQEEMDAADEIDRQININSSNKKLRKILQKKEAQKAKIIYLGLCFIPKELILTILFFILEKSKEDEYNSTRIC